jgi:hypothetical protein
MMDNFRKIRKKYNEVCEMKGVEMQPFKKCSCCSNPWFDRDEFLRDVSVQLIGYQPNFINLELGYFLFNHTNCKSTIAVPAGLFKDLYDGPVFAARMTGSESCPGYCLQEAYLDPCTQNCECAYIREIMNVIREWPKTAYRLAGLA